MRDFSNIPTLSPCWQDHEEWDTKVDDMIKRAANLLLWHKETEVLDMLLKEGATMAEAVNAVRAGAILDEDRTAHVAKR